MPVMGGGGGGGGSGGSGGSGGGGTSAGGGSSINLNPGFGTNSRFSGFQSIPSPKNLSVNRIAVSLTAIPPMVRQVR